MIAWQRDIGTSGDALIAVPLPRIVTRMICAILKELAVLLATAEFHIRRA